MRHRARGASRPPAARRTRRRRGPGRGRARFSGASVPTSLRSFCSAFSRTLHVLKTMTSRLGVRTRPRSSRRAQDLVHAIGVVHVHLAAERVDVKACRLTARDLPWQQDGGTLPPPTHEPPGSRTSSTSSSTPIAQASGTPRALRHEEERARGRGRRTPSSASRSTSSAAGSRRSACSAATRSPSSPNNRVEWAVVAYACFGLGAAFVPMYEAQLAKEWEFIVDDCEAKVAHRRDRGDPREDARSSSRRSRRSSTSSASTTRDERRAASHDVRGAPRRRTRTSPAIKPEREGHRAASSTRAARRATRRASSSRTGTSRRTSARCTTSSR